MMMMETVDGVGDADVMNDDVDVASHYGHHHVDCDENVVCYLAFWPSLKISTFLPHPSLTLMCPSPSLNTNKDGI